jgi:hypothetical protein
MRIGLENGGVIQWLAGEPGVAESVHSSVRDFSLKGERQLEVVPFVKGGFTKQFDRGNQANEVTFGTTRTFATADLTFLFELDYLDDIQLTGTLVFEIDIAGGGTHRRYMANAVMQRPEMDPIGVSLTLDFSVSGGTISEVVGHYLNGSGGAYLNGSGGFYLTGT